MTAEQNRQTLRDAYKAFNDHDPDAVRDSASPAFVDHTAAAELGEGFEATKRNIEAMVRAFPDVRWEVLDMVVDEHGGAARLRVTGTHRGVFKGVEPTGRSIDAEVVDFVRFDDDGRVTAHWGYMDSLTWMRQLGIDPRVAAGNA